MFGGKTKMKKLIAMLLTLMMITAALLALPAMAEDAESAGSADLNPAPAADPATVPETETADAPEATETSTAAEVANTAPADAAALQASAQKLDAIYTLALNAIGKEDYTTARKYLNIAFVYCDRETNPVIYADLLLKQACLDVIEGDNAIALLALDAALTVDPNLADAYLVRTQIYTTEGNFTQAAADLEKYIKLTQDATMYETVAQLYEASGDHAAAQAAYDKFAAAAGADNPDVGFQAALYRMDNGLYQEAIEAFQAYTENETYAAAAQYNIGICRMNLGDYAGAVEAFNACEATGNVYSGLFYNRGMCNLLSESWAAAADDFTRSIEAEPYTDDARYNLAICNMQQGEYEAAVTGFTELIDAVPAEGESAGVINPAVYYFRGVCNAALGNLEAAIADYTVCIDNGYELAQVYYQRAQVYAAMGDSENQNADLEKSLQQGN